jgi:PAS domain S-box-containing protein
MTSLRHGFEDPVDVQDTRLVVDTIPTLAWSARLDGSAEFFNQRWLAYTGLSAKQALGSGWEVAIHPDDLNDLVDYWRRVVASGQPGEIEGRLRRSDGVYRWFLFRATPSLDENGRVVNWYGTNTDIEERKKAERVLAVQNTRLQLLLQLTNGETSEMWSYWPRRHPVRENGRSDSTLRNAPLRFRVSLANQESSCPHATVPGCQIRYLSVVPARSLYVSSPGRQWHSDSS